MIPVEGSHVHHFLWYDILFYHFFLQLVYALHLQQVLHLNPVVIGPNDSLALVFRLLQEVTEVRQSLEYRRTVMLHVLS